MEHEYGSCNIFEDREIVVGQLNYVALRSNVEGTIVEDEDEVVLGFAQVDSITAIPALDKSSETVSFIKILSQSMNESTTDIVDDWGQVIKGGQNYPN